MHRERKWKNTFRPCEALCAPVLAFAGRSGIRVPLRQFFTALGACEGRLGENSIYAPSTRKYGRKAGSKSVQVKGRVAPGSRPARMTPPGKAVRGSFLPPRTEELENMGGLYLKITDEESIWQMASEKLDERRIYGRE